MKSGVYSPAGQPETGRSSNVALAKLSERLNGLSTPLLRARLPQT
jgi:hypothetical protein